MEGSIDSSKGSIDPTNEFDVFFPVVDLDSVALVLFLWRPWHWLMNEISDIAFRSFGKHVFACKPPVMLQAYAVSGYQGY